ncbi:MAG: hypothetical protein LBS79_02220 [Tannerella sp.]|jgi:hypothetical protein|nr:hypothetical protein [Tannerella sp.]
MKKTLFLSVLFCWGAVCNAHSQEETGSRETGRFISFTEGGVLAGNSDNWNSAPFIFHSSLNYAFGRHLSAGLGAGVEFLRETHLPVTANVLYRFGNRAAIRPFVRFQTGYLIALEDKTTANATYYYPSTSSYYPYSYYQPYQTSEMDARGGWLFNPSAGVIFYTKQKAGIALSAGYRHQTLHYAGKDDYRMQVNQNRLSLTLGIIF